MIQKAGGGTDFSFDKPAEYANCEEKRVLYVGLSRARDRLFISVPEFSTEEEQDAQALEIQVVRA